MPDRRFTFKYEDEYSDMKKISAGVPQDRGPILYLLYTRDIPICEVRVMANFAVDTATMAAEWYDS